jgi:hypothetical protein
LTPCGSCRPSPTSTSSSERARPHRSSSEERI